MSRLEGLEERAKRWGRLNNFDKSLSDVEEMVSSWEGDLPGMPINPDQIAAIEVIASVAMRFRSMMIRLKELKPKEYTQATKKADRQNEQTEKVGDLVPVGK